MFSTSFFVNIFFTIIGISLISVFLTISPSIEYIYKAMFEY